jgi:hypothetical protein
MARSLTNDFYNALLLDEPLRPAMVVDFGVDTLDHHRALQSAVKTGEAPVNELDEALGSGEKLNALIKKYASQWSEHITFKTDYDGFEEE